MQVEMRRCLVSYRAASALGSEESWDRQGDAQGLRHGDTPGTCLGLVWSHVRGRTWDVHGLMRADAPEACLGRAWGHVWGRARDAFGTCVELCLGTRPGLACRRAWSQVWGRTRDAPRTCLRTCVRTHPTRTWDMHEVMWRCTQGTLGTCVGGGCAQDVHGAST